MCSRLYKHRMTNKAREWAATCLFHPESRCQAGFPRHPASRESPSISEVNSVQQPGTFTLLSYLLFKQRSCGHSKRCIDCIVAHLDSDDAYDLVLLQDVVQLVRAARCWNSIGGSIIQHTSSLHTVCSSRLQNEISEHSKHKPAQSSCTEQNDVSRAAMYLLRVLLDHSILDGSQI